MRSAPMQLAGSSGLLLSKRQAVRSSHHPVGAFVGARVGAGVGTRVGATVGGIGQRSIVPDPHPPPMNEVQTPVTTPAATAMQSGGDPVVLRSTVQNCLE